MDEQQLLAEQFERNRSRLGAVAYRMLGSAGEAEDAVQESWLRLSRSDTSEVENLGGWLTTVVARVCLDMLRSRKARREDTLDGGEGRAEPIAADDPAADVELSDSVGIAMLVVLEALAPSERLAFVLHDMFSVPFEEIAPIVGRSPEAARQLASRARRRVRGAGADGEVDRQRQREVVDAFLAASRDGDFAALLEVLDPGVVLRADEIAVTISAERREAGAPLLAGEVRGADAVARVFAGRARAARPAEIDGAIGAVYAPGGRVRTAFNLTIADGRIMAIDVIMDPESLGALAIEVLGAA